MNIKLTSEHLIFLNEKVSNKNGESRSSLGNVQEKLERIKKIADAPYEKQDEFSYVYKNQIEKAAKLGNAIATQKPFETANTETAILATLTLLKLNKVELLDHYKKDIQMLKECIKDTEIDRICHWIHIHMVENIHKSILSYQ